MILLGCPNKHVVEFGQELKKEETVTSTERLRGKEHMQRVFGKGYGLYMQIQEDSKPKWGSWKAC